MMGLTVALVLLGDGPLRAIANFLVDSSREYFRCFWDRVLLPFDFCCTCSNCAITTFLDNFFEGCFSSSKRAQLWITAVSVLVVICVGSIISCRFNCTVHDGSDRCAGSFLGDGPKCARAVVLLDSSRECFWDRWWVTIVENFLLFDFSSVLQYLFSFLEAW